MSRRLAAALSCLVLLCGLASCAAEPRPRLTALPDASTPAPSDAATDAPDGEASVTPGCIDGVLRIGASAETFTVTADCARLEVSGASVQVFASDVEIGEVIVRGDRNVATVADPAQVIVEGQGNRVDAVTIGSLEIRGDRNEVFVDQTLSFVTVNGNTNGVQAGEIGSVTDNGDANVIGLR